MTSPRTRLARKIRDSLPFQITYEDARVILDHVLKNIQDQLVEDGTIHFPELGRLSVVHTPERKMFSNLTQREETIPPKTYVKYKSSVQIRERVKKDD